MVLEVQLYAALRRYVPSSASGVVVVDVSDDITVLDLIKELEINPAEIHTIVVNGISSEMSKVLFDGDRIDLFPVVGK
ncbi:MAG TPA: MoaD/ThiS family protein [Negativicutes bacterium]|jgi:molybdopterin converting factor small subunit